VAVESFSVTPLDPSAQPVDAVLVLDVSGSMEGEPLTAAVAAARRFVETLPVGVRAGLVTFSDQPTVVVPLTDAHDEVLTALDDVAVAGETSLYDAVAEAAAMFDSEAQRNIVLLSDGGDTASSRSLEETVTAVEDSGASVFSIGWRTTETDIGALRTLAGESGRYASAGSGNIERVYEALAVELSNQYLLTFESAHAAGGDVSITVGGALGNDTAIVPYPKAAAPPKPAQVPTVGPYRPPLLSGTWGLLVVIGLVFVAAFTLLFGIFQVPLRHFRDRVLRRRMGAGGTGPALEDDGEGGSGTWVPEPFAAAGQRLAESAGFADRLDRKLEQAGFSLRPGEFVAGAFLAGAVGGLSAGLLFGSPLWGLVAAVGCALIPIAALRVAVRRRLGQLERQVVDVLMIIASSLRAGHSFLQALDMVAQEISEPAAGEFTRAVSEIRLGRPVDEALAALAERMASEDFDWAMMAVKIQRDVGGNLAEVLDTVAETLRDREAVRRQVKVLSAEGRLSAGILTALPFVILLYVWKVTPGFLDPLIGTLIGRVLLVGGGLLLVAGILIMRRMVRIDV
jgi:tight adherence protein B